MSSTVDDQGTTQALREEVAHLQERVRELERELVEVQAHANDAVAEWEERAYWLDRWHIDLNALMRYSGASRVRALLRAIRAPLRLARKAIRAMRA